jgi:hypothetical protein
MFMMTDPATAIKWDVFQLVELQIETLRQEGRLSDSALIEYHARSEKITELYHEIDREVRERFDWRSARASLAFCASRGPGRRFERDNFRWDGGL